MAEAWTCPECGQEFPAVAENEIPADAKVRLGHPGGPGCLRRQVADRDAEIKRLSKKFSQKENTVAAFYNAGFVMDILDRLMKYPIMDKVTDTIGAAYEFNELCRRAMVLEAEIERLRGELARWPRVYFECADPATLSEGRRVLSVSARIGESNCDCFCDIAIEDGDGNEIAAPVDFGLYSTSEAANAAKEKA